MANPLNETTFEAHITKMLANSVLYNERRSADFDIETLCDKEMLERFLRAQELTWKKLSQFFPGRETETVIKEYNNFINRGDSILRLLQKGITIKGIKVKFVQFQEALRGSFTTRTVSVWFARCDTVLLQLLMATVRTRA